MGTRMGTTRRDSNLKKNCCYGTKHLNIKNKSKNYKTLSIEYV